MTPDEQGQELIDNIKSSVTFKKIATNGSHSLNCPACGDTKGKGAFFFGHDHIGYSCFRGKCPLSKTRWSFGAPMSRKLRDLLNQLGVEIPIRILTSKKGAGMKELFDEHLYEKPKFEKVTIPKEFIKYDPKIHSEYRRYLEDRCLDDTDYYIGRTVNDDDDDGWMWDKMLVVPLYYNGQLIGFQGRRIDKKMFKTSTSDLIYLPDGKVPDSPIVVESIYDAKSIPNGVAVLHSTVSKKQAYLLKNKKPILLPDRSGSNFMKVAKSYKWRMSIPNWDQKDANEVLADYGLFVMCRLIHEGICTNPFEAEVKYKMWVDK